MSSPELNRAFTGACQFGCPKPGLFRVGFASLLSSCADIREISLTSTFEASKATIDTPAAARASRGEKMSNSERNQLLRKGIEALRTDKEAEAAMGCQASALKDLLNTIVNQITEADQRHADALHHMRDRLASLNADARSMRERVPEDLKFAFDRIETGMAELSSRLSGFTQPQADADSIEESEAIEDGDADSGSTDNAAEETLFVSEEPTSNSRPSRSEPAANPASAIAEQPEPPVALRSAQNPNQKIRPRDEASAGSTVDTFDVIESLPGNASEPWDSDSAEMLASVYDAEIPAYPSDNYASVPAAEPPRSYVATPSPLPSASCAPVSSDDRVWLDMRLAEIAERIEASIAEIRPDQSFFALGQRLDQFENVFVEAMESVAGHNGADGLQLIESHMGELVTHLENTHNQVQRLETIEAQIAAIAARLDDVQSAAGGGPGGADFDIAAIAKAVAQETAASLSSLKGAASDGGRFDDVRGLIERSIADARQSEENTSALLDTLQQAMIRLLDRMDAIELGEHHVGAAESHSVAQPAFGRSPRRYGGTAPAYDGSAAYDEDGLDAAVASVATHAHKRTMASVPEPAFGDSPDWDDEPQAAPRRGLRSPPIADVGSLADEEPRPEQIRQDFIAEARRAKMRLASQDGDEEVILTTAPAGSEAIEELPPSKRPVGKVAKNKAAPEKSGSILTPRVVALSLALAVASGAYMLMPGKSDNAAPPVVKSDVAGAPKAAPKKVSKNAKAPAAGKTPAKPAAPGEAPPPAADFGKQSSVPDAAPRPADPYRTEGRVVTGDARLELPGVAVATDENVTPADIARAQRHSAIAGISGKLGQAAGEMAAGAIPAALIPDSAAGTGSSPQVAEGKTVGALDLPPATVGPLSLRLAAANGDPSAQFEVGARLAEGKGTDQNFSEAAKWYHRSASQSFVQSQYRLGTLYERGLGLKADEERAKDWYLRAAEQGSVKAMHNLAVLNANGRARAPNYPVAAHWFGKAAERGLSDSQFNLAVLHENGLGVPADLKLAYKWLSLAANSGDKEAVRRRDILKGKLTSKQLAEAETLVSNFRAVHSDPLANDARTAGEHWKRNPATGASG